MTNAKRNYFIRLNNSLKGLLSDRRSDHRVKNVETGALEEAGRCRPERLRQRRPGANVRVLPLGTDNFGRDVLTELVTPPPAYRCRSVLWPASSPPPSG
jgi:peptide/nickel transport system permease protein